MGEANAKKATIAYFEVLSGLFLFLVLLLVLFTAALGDNQIFLVLLGFFPTILTVIISLVVYEQYMDHRKILWLLPLIIVGIFYFIGKSNTGLAGGLDIDVLSGINFILSVIYVLVVFSVFKDLELHKAPPKVVHHHHKVEREGDIKDYINSIEDKSKALNFAIGRVYSTFHGGSKEIRDSIKIPKEWYNEFSFIGVGTDNIDLKKLNEIVAKFEIHLRLFEKTEKEVFGKHSGDLKNIIRDIEGRDKVIEVLDHNDKDPVRSYYEGALTFCEKIREEMKKKELKLVKNTYIPKSDEEKEEIKAMTAPSEEVKKKEKYFPKPELKKGVKKIPISKNIKVTDIHPHQDKKNSEKQNTEKQNSDRKKKNYFERKPLSNHP